MTQYSAASSLLGLGYAGSSVIQAWFDSHNPKAPANLGVAILSETSKAGLNADLVAAQICHETGFWTSAWADENNPAGLGVTGVPGAGLTFPTPQMGIHAMCAHLLSYIEGAANPWKSQDPRYSDMPAAYLGSVKVLSDLDGKWAVPGVGYGASIAQLANELITTIGGVMANGRDDIATWAPSSNFDSGRAGYSISHITDHMTAGTDSLNWLRGAAGGSDNTDSSSTYLIERDGHTYQLVDENDTEYADGDLPYNRSGLSIEHESKDGTFTEAQIVASIALHVRIAQRHGWKTLVHPGYAVEPETPPTPPAGTGFVYGHSQIPDPNNPALGGGIDHHTGCPGPQFPFDRIIAEANAQLAGQPAPAPDPNTYTDPVTGFKIIGGMLARYRQLDAALEAIGDAVVVVIGRPVENEHEVSPGVIEQRFEKETWQWRKGQSPQRFDILAVNINPFVKQP